MGRLLNNEKDISLLKESELLYGSFQEMVEMQLLYNSAIKQVSTKLEILNEEFNVKHARNPIHHVEGRLKTPQSIVKKLQRKNMDISMKTAKEINDIAGIRVVCAYLDDVYNISEMLLSQTDIKLIKYQDYIKEPNFNGYRSLHLDIEVPVFLSDHIERVIVEIQIRTVAQDFWASLEHDIRYKSDKYVPKDICDEMLQSANEIATIDLKMQETFKKIQNI
ncbi:MAG: RelA/SpoT domain protein [Sedimentibacter sp.]|nr:RelA/SpoT domain protein [Sedimentibacter sp.]